MTEPIDLTGDLLRQNTKLLAIILPAISDETLIKTFKEKKFMIKFLVEVFHLLPPDEQAKKQGMYDAIWGVVDMFKAEFERRGLEFPLKLAVQSPHE